MCSSKATEDWEITEDGLYVATRDYLIRRGFCCAHKCRNCPYINWRNQSQWEPLPAECIKSARVAPKSMAGAQTLLHYHEQQLEQCEEHEVFRHKELIEHYKRLLKCWGKNRQSSMRY
jgi:hypothetical protein